MAKQFDCIAEAHQAQGFPDSIVYSDCWRVYDMLDVSGFHHFRINHSKLFADRHNHINGTEGH